MQIIVVSGNISRISECPIKVHYVRCLKCLQFHNCFRLYYSIGIFTFGLSFASREYMYGVQNNAQQVGGPDDRPNIF